MISTLLAVKVKLRIDITIFQTKIYYYHVKFSKVSQPNEDQ